MTQAVLVMVAGGAVKRDCKRVMSLSFSLSYYLLAVDSWGEKGAAWGQLHVRVQKYALSGTFSHDWTGKSTTPIWAFVTNN